MLDTTNGRVRRARGRNVALSERRDRLTALIETSPLVNVPDQAAEWIIEAIPDDNDRAEAWTLWDHFTGVTELKEKR
jgi:hypothetical protein